jgi:hypothetical protein
MVLERWTKPKRSRRSLPPEIPHVTILATLCVCDYPLETRVRECCVRDCPSLARSFSSSSHGLTPAVPTLSCRERRERDRESERRERERRDRERREREHPREPPRDSRHGERERYARRDDERDHRDVAGRGHDRDRDRGGGDRGGGGGEGRRDEAGRSNGKPKEPEEPEVRASSVRPALLESVRDRLAPPCRHFKILSCWRLGSAFELAAFQTPNRGAEQQRGWAQRMLACRDTPRSAFHAS